MLERQIRGRWFSEGSYSSPQVTEENPGPREGKRMAYSPVVHLWGPPAPDLFSKPAAPVRILSWGSKGMALVDGDLEESRRMTCSSCQAHAGPLLSDWGGEPLELPEFSSSPHPVCS